MEWSYSSIENVHHHSIYSSDILKLHFHNVQITSLTSRAFEQNAIQEIVFDWNKRQIDGKGIFVQKWDSKLDDQSFGGWIVGGGRVFEAQRVLVINKQLPIR